MGREITSTTQIFTEDMKLQIGDWVLLGTHIDAAPPAAALELVMTSHYRFVSNSANVYKGVVA
jgi:hypothetical protein